MFMHVKSGPRPEGWEAVEENRPNRVAVVVGVRVEPPFVLDLLFEDGTKVRKDMAAFVKRAPGILSKLADPAFFAKVRVSREKGTVEWPGEIDLCPESLAGHPLAASQRS